MKTTRMAVGLALFGSMFAPGRAAEANSKLHFLKSKKFWKAAVAVSLPAAASGVLATQGSPGAVVPRPTPTSTQPRK